MFEQIEKLFPVLGWPFWALFSLTVACIFLLYDLTPMDQVNIAIYRGELWVAVIILGALTIGKAGNAFFVSIHYWRQAKQKRTLNISQPMQRSFCHYAKQKNGEVYTQLSIHLDVTNLLEEPTRLINPKILKPKVLDKDLSSMFILTRDPQGRMYGSQYLVPPRRTTDATISVMIKKRIRSKNKFLPVQLSISDQFGNENFFAVKLPVN
jgi:hypothetical protein